MTFQHLPHAERGYVTRAQFLGEGYNDRDIRSAIKAGVIQRRRQGIYVYNEQFKLLTPEQKHVIDLRSVADKLGPAIAISHQSACAIHGIATYELGLDKIHVTRLDGSAGRTEYGIVHHVGKVDDDDLMEIDGMLVVKPARAMFEASTLHTVESAIVTLDSGLHLALSSPEELAELGGRWWNWQGARKARYALTLADGRAQSPGESRSRYLFRCENLPTPDLQVAIYDEDGRLIGYTDFGWMEYRHLGEFDGRVKYGGIADDPRTPQEIVIDEKLREDAMRSRLLGMTRWGWVDINAKRGKRTAARVRAGLEQSRRLYTRNGTIIPLA